MKIVVKWIAEPPKGTDVLDFQDLGCDSELEWMALSKNEKRVRVQNYLDNSAEQPYKDFLATTYRVDMDE